MYNLRQQSVAETAKSKRKLVGVDRDIHREGSISFIPLRIRPQQASEGYY